MHSIPIEYFQCPETGEPLLQTNSGLKSSATEYIKDPVSDFYDMTPTNRDFYPVETWDVWNQLQDNGMVSYEAEPMNNLAVGPRQDVQDFCQFCELDGLILDVGCGPQKHPATLDALSDSSTLIGLDPLVGQQPRDFAYVKGIGERLPFRNKLFDRVMFVTSLDHFISPKLAIIEAKRVVSTNGYICIWIGEKTKDAPRPKVSKSWYENLRVPEGAEDPFHYKRLTSTELVGCFSETGLDIVEQKIIELDEYRRNVFFKLR